MVYKPTTVSGGPHPVCVGKNASAGTGHFHVNFASMVDIIDIDDMRYADRLGMIQPPK